MFVNDGAKWSLFAAQLCTVTFWVFVAALPRADESIMVYMWDVAIYTVPVLMVSVGSPLCRIAPPSLRSFQLLSSNHATLHQFANNKLALAPETTSIFSLDPSQSLRWWHEGVQTVKSEGNVTLPAVTIQPLLWQMIEKLEYEGDENAGKLIVAGLAVSNWLKANAGVQSTTNAVLQRTLDSIIAIVVTIFIDVLIFPIDLRRQIRATNTRVWDLARSFLSMWTQALRTEELADTREGSFYDTTGLKTVKHSDTWECRPAVVQMTEEGNNKRRRSVSLDPQSLVNADGIGDGRLLEPQPRGGSSKIPFPLQRQGSNGSVNPSNSLKIGIRRASVSTIDTDVTEHSVTVTKRRQMGNARVRRSQCRMESHDVAELKIGRAMSTLSVRLQAREHRKFLMLQEARKHKKRQKKKKSERERRRREAAEAEALDLPDGWKGRRHRGRSHSSVDSPTVIETSASSAGTSSGSSSSGGYSDSSSEDDKSSSERSTDSRRSSFEVEEKVRALSIRPASSYECALSIEPEREQASYNDSFQLGIDDDVDGKGTQVVDDDKNPHPALESRQRKAHKHANGAHARTLSSI